MTPTATHIPPPPIPFESIESINHINHIRAKSKDRHECSLIMKCSHLEIDLPSSSPCCDCVSCWRLPCLQADKWQQTLSQRYSTNERAETTIHSGTEPHMHAWPHLTRSHHNPLASSRRASPPRATAAARATSPGLLASAYWAKEVL